MDEKLKMRSRDRVEENIRKIGALFPGCITERRGESGEAEAAIDFDALRQELSSAVVEDGEERYRFTWPGKRNAVARANRPTTRTLRPCREESVDFDTTKNLYIEGDNLDVLKLLQETYLGKVKLIYIDPPYNTGKDGFVYDDDFGMTAQAFSQVSGQYDEEGNLLFDLRDSSEKNGKYHSDWLSMIYPRIKLARDLLSEDGIILINIDENEITNLQRVCQEIFGEQNDLGLMVWDKRNPKGDAQGISCQHEYILTYARNQAAFLEKNKMMRPKKNADLMLRKAAKLFAQRSPEYTLDQINREFAAWLKGQTDLSGGERAYCRIDENGDVYRLVSMAWPNKKRAPEEYFIPLIHPATGKPCPVPDRGWRNPPATMKKLMDSGRIVFGKDESTIPNCKYLLRENRYENIPSMIYYGGSDTALLEEIGVPFDTPKAVEVCKEHILAFTGGEDIVLDFFSGSATTAHAVLLANAQDGGKRRYIMVQLPEKCKKTSALHQKGFTNICQAGRARIRRCAERIEGVSDKGFRVLRLDTSNMKDVYYTPEEYTPDLFAELADNIKPDRTGEDLLFQVMLELGVMPSSGIEEREIAGKRVFWAAEGFLAACFDREVPEEALTEIAKGRPHYFVTRDKSLATDSVWANMEQIFRTWSPGTTIKVL